MSWRNKNADVDLEQRVERLEAAMHALVEILCATGSPMRTRMFTQHGYDAPPVLEQFLSRHDLMTGKVTRPGIGAE